MTRLVDGIAHKTREKLGISSRLVYVDTTSFSVSETYGVRPEAEVAISITYRYLRDHRADLKQWMLALAAAQGSDLPLFLRPLDGNSSDQVSLLAAVEALQKELRAGGRGRQYLRGEQRGVQPGEHEATQRGQVAVGEPRAGNFCGSPRGTDGSVADVGAVAADRRR